GQTGAQGPPGEDGEYCACPPKSLPGVYSLPNPAPSYPQQPYYSTSYQNNGPSAPAPQPYVRYPFSVLTSSIDFLILATPQPTSTEAPQYRRNRRLFQIKPPGLRIVDSFWKRRRTD
ncbi:hypothetical protein PENTCL1PPCAC_20839, partial [Pristionchus entomophagus]